MSGFRYMCDKCDLTFKCPKSLEDHANSVHEGEKSTLNKYLFNDIFAGIFYQCDQCDYKCGHRSSFKQHYKAEHQNIRFPCDQCEYQAKDRSSLKQHLNTGEENLTKSAIEKRTRRKTPLLTSNPNCDTIHKCNRCSLSKVVLVSTHA